MPLRLLLFLLGISIGLFLLDRNSRVLLPVRGVAEWLMVPAQSGLYSLGAGIGNTFRVLTFWQSGEERIRLLEQKSQELTVRSARLEEVLAENVVLKKQLSAVLPARRPVIPAQVISAGGKMAIAVGERDGVRVGQSVVLGGALVGVIVKTDPFRSLVERPFSSDSKILVRIGDVRGVVLGQFDSSMLLDKVSQNENLKVGDLAVTTGEGSADLPNLVVGRISNIESAGSEIFKRAKLEPVIDENYLRTVFVVLE